MNHLQVSQAKVRYLGLFLCTMENNWIETMKTLNILDWLLYEEMIYREMKGDTKGQ